jgi:NAD(P)-dependent dehydrogenase (short-subunit alcohol dehydrogenase family)
VTNAASGRRGVGNTLQASGRPRGIRPYQDLPRFLQGKDNATIESIKRTNPLGRLAEVEDIAKVVSLLVDPDSGWINGQVVRANGGVV